MRVGKNTGAVLALWVWALLVPGRATLVPPMAPPPITLDENELQEVLRLLKSQYADPAAIKNPALDRSAINGVLSQLGPGALLTSRSSLDGANLLRILPVVLSSHIGYWRCSSFLPAKDWKTLEVQLTEWNRWPVLGLIIDVRDFGDLNNYSGAAQVASYFTAPGASLFTIQGLQTPQRVYSNTRASVLFRQPIIVLTNARTLGAGEVLAAVLRVNAGAIVVGRSTAGQEAFYTETKLQSGRYLRLASAQAVLGNGTRLFGIPLVPDIGLFVDDRDEREALWQIELGGVEKVIAELPLRKKLSEASLVRDENPEIDEAWADQEAEKNPAANADYLLQDRVLMRGVDVLRAIQFSRTAR